MSASITLIGNGLLSQRDIVCLWLDTFGIAVQTRHLTNHDDPIQVERLELSRPLPEEDLGAIRAQLLSWSDSSQIDHIYQTQAIEITQPGVAVFDMDSTLIRAEVMDELAVEAGIGEQISAITAAAMRGELDFTQSFVKRLALLNGLNSAVMQSVYDRIQPMEGIECLMKVLHHYNWHTAILSGGFTFFADKLAQRYGIKEVHANSLEITDGKLTGRHVGSIVDAVRKQQLLTQIVEQRGVSWSATMACGDGANDLLMLNKAHLGVALHAKPLVRRQAPHPLNNLGLDGILYLMGLDSEQIHAILTGA